MTSVLLFTVFTAALSALSAPTAQAAPAPSETDSGVELNILCANLWGLAWPLSKDRGDRLSVAPDSLDFDAYDFVGLQEIWRGAIRHLPEDAVRVPEVQVDSGLAIAGTLSAGASIALHTFEASEGVERFKRKGVLVTQLNVPDVGPVWAFVTHLQAGQPYGETREAQARELLALLESVPGPAIILGDFNLHHGDPADDAVAALLTSAGLRDVAHIADDEGPTYRADNPYIWAPAAGERFDRIYLKDGPDAALSVVDFAVLDYAEPLSDHQPLRVKLRITQPNVVALE